MKAIRFISILLILATVCCPLVACDQGDATDIDLPERDFYEVTVSFQIKDKTGRTVIEAIDYKYKSHAEPTVLNVVDTYLAVVQDWVCKIDKTNTLTQIGGMKANKNNGEYWGFVTNVETDSEGNLALNGKTAINLSLEQINRNLSDGKMCDAKVIDGAEFTLILKGTE